MADPVSALIAEVSSFTTHLAVLINQMSQPSIEAVSANGMFLSNRGAGFEQVQYVNNWNFNNCRGSHMLNYYHPNFSYADMENILQPPHGFNYPKVEQKPSLEDLMITFVATASERFEKNESMLDNIETRMGNIEANMKSLEAKIELLASSMANQQTWDFPSDTEVNPNEQSQIITCRSGKEFKDTSQDLGSKENEMVFQEETVTEEENKGELIMRGQYEEITFSVFRAMPSSQGDADCHMIDTVEKGVETRQGESVFQQPMSIMQPCIKENSLQLNSKPLPKGRKKRKRKASSHLEIIPGRLKRKPSQFCRMCSPEFPIEGKSTYPGGPSMDKSPQPAKLSFSCHKNRWIPKKKTDEITRFTTFKPP